MRLSLEVEQGSFEVLSQLAPPRVLLGEPDDEARSAQARALRADGYDVVEVEDGFELIDYLTLEPEVDAVVADARLEGYNGLEVLALLRRMENEVPFVLVSTGASDQTYRDAERLGADLVVEGPWDVDEIRNAVFSVVRY